MSHFTMDWSELSLQVMLTFAHFLWQACVIAIALAIGEQISNIVSGRARALRSHQPTPDCSCESATVRYLVACLAFFALPACVAATFTWVHQSRGPILLAESAAVESPALVVASIDERVEPSVSIDIPILPSMEMATGTELPVAEASEPSVRAQSWTQRMQAYTPYLLIAYAVGATFMLARFGVSILGSSRLCRTVQPVVDSKLLKIIAEQSSRLGLQRVPIVALCQRVTVPVVVGIVKPMILLPPSLVCGLDPNQLAAILSHELAHIRRFDLLVNLLQRVFEALLFFHPVTWWISRRIRIERENCCDDLAVAGCGRIEYAAALLRMAEQCATIRGLKIAPQLDSLAADGGNASQLGYRIRRLLGDDDSPRISLTRISLSAITLAVVLGGLSMVAVAQSDDDPWGDESHGLVCRILPVSPSMDADTVDMEASVDRFSSPDDLTFAVELKNVSDQPIHLKDIRYGNDYAEETRGKLNANHYAPHLFEFTFTDGAGKAVAHTQREFTLDSHAMILRGAYVAKLEPNQSLKCLLKPAKFERSMAHRLPPGDYGMQVDYRGPSPAAKEWIAEHHPGQQLDELWPHQVTSNVAKFSISAEEFRKPDLVWGTETDGLQAALEIRVPRESGIPTRAPGVLPETSLHPVLHVKNVSDKPITFVSETGRQGDRLQIKTAAGEDVKVKDAWMSGWPIDVRWTLQPGDVAELDVLTPSLNQGLAAGEYSALYTIRFNSRQLKDKDGNQVFPAPGDYDSEIDTGWTPLFIRTEDQASADNEVETFVYETLQKPYRPEHNGSTWQAGAHRSMIWLTLASIPQQDLVADALMKKIEFSVGSVDLHSRQLALDYCAQKFPDRLLPYLIRHLSATDFPAPDLQISGAGRPFYAEINAIGDIGEQAKAAIPALTKHLSAADPIAREATIRALVRVGPSDPEVMQSLTECFNDDSQRVQSTAVYEAGRYGKLAKPLGPKFAELLDAESKEVQYWAAAALITSEFDPDLGFRKLLEGASTGSTADRSQPLTALAMLGTRSEAMLPTLRALINDPDTEVVRKVHKAVHRIETNDRIVTHSEEAAKRLASQQRASNAQSKWIPAPPLKATVSRGGTAKILDDHSVRFEGDVRWQEASLQFAFDKPISVEAIRLEILPVDSPTGPQFGRGGNKLMLFDVKPSIEDQAGKSLSLDFARCTYLQNPDDETLAHCIDHLTDTGWKMPNLPADAAAHELVLQFETPITLRAGQRLTLSVDSGGADEFAVLNRIRFAFHLATAREPADEKEEVGLKPSPTFTRDVVVLEPPIHTEPNRIPLINIMRGKFILLVGRLGKPEGKGTERTAEFLVDRTIAPGIAEQAIAMREELPTFRCAGPVLNSKTYPLGEPILWWMTRELGKWQVIAMQNLTPETRAIIDAVTGNNQADALRPLIAFHGMDLQTTDLIKFLASPQQVAPLMREIIRDTPALLEPLQGVKHSQDDARWRERWKLVHNRLTRAIDVLLHFSKSTDTSVIDLTIPCFPLLRDDGGEELRLHLTWHLAMICQAGHLDPEHHRLSDEHATALRTLFWDETKCSTPNSNAERFAYLGLGLLSDAKTITALIKAQNQRPIGASHAKIVSALSNTISVLDAADTEALRIKASWIDSLRGLSETSNSSDKENEHTQGFATAIAHSLYQKQLIDDEARTLRMLGDETKVAWLKELIASTFNDQSGPALQIMVP